MRHSTYIAIIFLFIGSSLHAQFSSRFNVTSSFDDNIYRSPFPTSDLLTDLELNLIYEAGESNLRFQYNGNMILYRDLKIQNFSVHSLGTHYFKSFGEDDIHSFYLGGDWTSRINGDDYNYYDFNQLYAYFNLRLDLDYMFLKTGYNFRYRNYLNIPELSNYRHYLFAQINKSFETRTTVILEADLGYKSFTTKEMFETMDGGRLGQGQHSQTYTYSTTSLTEIPPMGQLILLARVAQSIYDKMGIYIQYRQQVSLTDDPTYFTADYYYYDEDLFDDPFSYNGKNVSTQLTWLLPWTTSLRVGGSIIAKDYLKEQAYISIEDTIGLGNKRSDDQNSLYIDISKTFHFNKRWLNSLRLNFYYNFVDNRSNSFWYNYKNSIVGGGIQWLL